MPTYQYACTGCDHRFEAVQRFSDSALTECPECEGTLRKVFSSVGIVFKGSGFYRTDSRSNGRVDAAASSSDKSGSAEKSGSSDSSSSSNSSSTTSSSGSSSSGSSASKSSTGTTAKAS